MITQKKLTEMTIDEVPVSLLAYKSWAELKEAYIWAQYVHNKGDFRKTARAVGASEPSIRSWISQYTRDPLEAELRPNTRVNKGKRYRGGY